MSTTTINVMCAADRAFLRHVPTMLNSVRAKTSSPIKVSIVSTDWEDDHKVKLRQCLAGMDIDFLTLSPDLLKGLPYKAMLSPLTYARILMADLVTYDKFIYMDIDMIAKRDLNDLWRIDLKGAPAAAVFHDAESGLNAGLLLINGKVWRERKLSVAMLDFVRKNQPKQADQDAIEGVVGSEMLRLDVAWNTLVDPVWGRSFLSDNRYFEDAAILHYINGFKPWNLGRYLLPKNFASEWQRYHQSTKLPVDWKAEIKTVAWQLYILAKLALKK